jgi:hypothetical protein
VRSPPDEANVTDARQRLETSLGPNRARALGEEGLGMTLDELAEQRRHHEYARTHTPV